jgi:hypothetical protein
MVRWQNKLLPFIFETKELSYTEIEYHLGEIEKAREVGKKMLERLKMLQKLREKIDSDSSGQELSGMISSTDVQELSKRIEETIVSCTTLHDALLSQQAVIALKGITSLQDALNPIQKPTASLRELEVFNAQVAITDFSASFRELEAEYVRVRSEEDVGQQINKMLEQ